MIGNSLPSWPRPLVLPIPETVPGVEHPVISLSGMWKRLLAPPKDFWRSTFSAEDWESEAVPGPVFPPRDGEQPASCGYLTSIPIPNDFSGQRIFLRLDGVGGYAQLWVNGQFVRDHFGGFTPWCAEITSFVSPGQEANLALRSTSHRVGVLHTDVSILREPLLIAVPADFISHFHADTELDASYQNALLRIHVGLNFGAASSAQVEFSLHDSQQTPLSLTPAQAQLSLERPECVVEIPVPGIRTWDAEHPVLYTLTARLVQNGRVQQVTSRQIGFRKIEVRDRRVFVNGKEVKLRGANRHDIWPTTGRSVTPEQCEQDARLFKEANFNFIRTSHYPPNEAFITACDRVGIYVEDEIAIMFVKTHEHNDPDLEPLFMGQFSEMIERDRSHPSVLMWSMGNESAYGRNIQKQIDYVRAEDPTRPIIFSWGDLIPFDPKPPVDIFSLHYAFYDADPGEMSDLWVGTAWNTAPGKNFTRAAKEQLQGKLPILHDEYAHIPAYDVREQMRDPGVRSFWGETIHRFWDAIYRRDGALGGAIWAGIDDLILDPQVAAYPHFEWGIIDVWRRPKPEYWLTKKAYSPVRLPDGPIPNPGSGHLVSIPIENRFDHTTLDEVKVQWSVAAERGEFAGPPIPPHAAGILTLPRRDWQDDEILHLEFTAPGGLLVDEYNLPIGRAAAPTAALARPGLPLHAEQDASSMRLTGQEFTLIFNKTTGLISSGRFRNEEVIQSGPHLHLEGAVLGDWVLHSFEWKLEQANARIEIAGNYGAVGVHFTLTVDGSGQIAVRYKVDNPPLPPIPKPWVHLSSDAGGFREVGVSFVLSGKVDRLAWRRKGYWSAYPADHIARTEGTARREPPAPPQPLYQPPAWPWSQDTRNPILYGRYDPGDRGTNDFRSLKENIYTASALLSSSQAGLRAESDGSLAVRLALLDDPQAFIDDQDPAVRFSGAWRQIEDDPNCFAGGESLSNTPGSAAEVEFNGTGICWLGSRDTYYGKADVYLDGKFQTTIDCFSGGTNWDMPLGQDKLPRAYLYTVEDLPQGQHKLRIVVLGEKNPLAQNTFVSVDTFRLLGVPSRSPVRFIACNQWNYPEVGWVRWGNYTRDAVLLEPGYTNEVVVRLAGEE